MRVGVIWAAVEPQPGSYDDTYLASIAQTVQTMAAHGILSPVRSRSKADRSSRRPARRC
jgi:hypothetical protein